MILKLGKTIALVFVACAFQIHVMAGVGLTGKLKTRDNKPVLVNNNKAISGTTILSGSQIQCPDKIGATVDLGSLGRLDIAPNSSLSLSFSAGGVEVQLQSGYVILTTNKGISGVVTTTDGTVFATDPSRTSSVVAKTKDAVGPEAGVPIGASVIGSGARIGVGGAAAAVAGGAAAAKSGKRGSGLSTDNPRQP
jgi:hypothetical protein